MKSLTKLTALLSVAGVSIASAATEAAVVSTTSVSAVQAGLGLFVGLSALRIFTADYGRRSGYGTAARRPVLVPATGAFSPSGARSRPRRLRRARLASHV